MGLRFRFIAVLFLLAAASAQSQKTDILLLGSDHLAQVYKQNKPNTDVFLPKRQQELKAFTASVIRYNPDMIMVEVLPEEQARLDSLYTSYLQSKLDFETLPDGRSEVYQLAFRMGKQLGLQKIYCVNAPGATSQSILDNGDGIELYKKEGMALRAIVAEKQAALQQDSLSFNDYLTFVNRPDIINKIYHLRYIAPARVTNGTFKNPDAMVDTGFINPKYIGAELTSVFKNRDYKIYANIIAAQRNKKAKRALPIIGAAHIGSLKSILRDDEEFNVVETSIYLKHRAVPGNSNRL